MLGLAANDLIKVLKKYKQSDAGRPIVLSEGNWTISEGGNDRWFDIYYNHNHSPVADCIAGEVSVYGFSDKNNAMIKEIILIILDYLK